MILMIIKKFNEKQKISEVGGKAKNLSELSSFTPVPKGFTVTTKGFRAFIKENDLKKEIKKAFKRMENKEKPISKTSSRLKKLILQNKLPSELAEEIEKAHEKLKNNKKQFTVAVRSSAVDEDNPKTSFAGQHGTKLNIDKKNLLKAVKKCFASLYNERALHYRKNRDILNHEIEIAVIIQKMIHPEASGVMFTRDPITRDETKIMIETVPGLGEPLVQGKATPDFYKIDKSTGEILEEKIETQKSKYTQNPETGKIIEKKTNKKKRSTPWIDKEQLKTLIDYAKRIESYYSSPQDIEWVLDKKGKIWIVQSRPETSSN